MTEEMFGPYRLEELLGRGGMGEVYRAFDTVRGRVVALKRLPAALAADTEFQARFRAEAALAARLHEPHIIPIHDFGEIDGRLFIDMRLVEGSDLAAFLAEHGPLAPRRAVNVVAQVAAALDVAHAEGLVHRDIKPGNILVSPGVADQEGDGEFVYVADFGIARAVSGGSTSLTATGTTVGSLDYMAPERFTDGHGDHRVDVYSLGCLLFEALTARKPFVGEGFPAMIHAHLNVPPPRPSQHGPDVPAGLDAVVARAMAKNPEDRYASAGALAAAARAATGSGAGEPSMPARSPQSQADTWVPSAGRRLIPSAAGGRGGAAGALSPVPASRRRFRPTLVLLAVVATVFALLGGGALALQPGEPPPQSGGPPSPPEIRTDPVGDPGDNPFMPPVGTDRAGVTPPMHSGGTFGGGTSGLYGGTLNNAACDPDAMTTFLQANPEKGAAWAQVQGITPAEIPSYVARLTPVILRSDTAVTNHGFANGRATTVPAVLQAGTAVLVDEYGVPRARCYCGNPLTPPMSLAEPRYVGRSWSGFSPSAITTVEPAAAPITAFTLVDPATNEVFDRPLGSRGGADSPRSSQTTTQVPITPPTVPDPVITEAPVPPPERQQPTSQRTTQTTSPLVQQPSPSAEPQQPITSGGPTFVYPQDGQTLEASGSYLFEVNPVAGASGYLFGFFQNETMVWENYRDEGSLSGTEYGIHPGTRAHSSIRPGVLQVWVRALVDGQWTDATIINLTIA